MDEWTPVFLLPNVELAEAIEGDLAVLAPAHDPRVAALGQAHVTFSSFHSRFTDAFGVELAPTVLLLRSNAPKAFFDIGALASFRDLIAVTVIGYNRALEIKYPHGHRIFFGDTFAFYPWMVDNDYKHLICRTPAAWGLHDVKKFQGQSSPELFPMRLSLGSHSIDEPLLRELLVRWRRRYESDAPIWSDIALFRSLNMAYHASLMPAASDATFYDVGRLVSLWVSAFEILVHPGGNGQANRDKVLDLIERVAWEYPACKDRSYDTGGKGKIKRTLASWLYQALNDRRNDFLHGNPVSGDHLRLPVSNRNLFEYAAPLYRLALTAFLPLVFDREMPSMSDAEALGSYIADELYVLGPQRAVEEALLTAVRPPDDAKK